MRYALILLSVRYPTSRFFFSVEKKNNAAVRTDAAPATGQVLKHKTTIPKNGGFVFCVCAR